ncbi:antitoxin of toxin-antitoxin stability system [Roseicyclus mahoneyensis]|uniref:Antitoxin of toxin-antitoxin stability system n=1 Tax=Roseicyclus mahoneyensis TaxID=164332 RepID=A0A316GL42_9RHOB|nr:antitoxin of toxin-antitoxin stability system [Roseicyclus mahoneyensis]PWK55547.1 hypothetical protein C7455_11711 [Roseicyclus mahoneyensis]
MPRIVETLVYRLDELDAPAQDRARGWYRGIGFDHDWHDAVYDDFQQIAAILGLRFRTTPVRLYGGGTRQAPCIWFRGFWSQGDGAAFEAWYRYAPRAAQRIRAHAPQDVELHRITEALQQVQRRNFYQLRAETSLRGHYCHARSMVIAVARDSPTGQEVTEDAEEVVAEALRDLSDWLYRQLQREYEYLTSDAAIDEVIRANDYSFTVDGRRFG